VLDYFGLSFRVNWTSRSTSHTQVGLFSSQPRSQHGFRG